MQAERITGLNSTAVERDHIYHLIDPVRPNLEVM